MPRKPTKQTEPSGPSLNDWSVDGQPWVFLDERNRHHDAPRAAWRAFADAHGVRIYRYSNPNGPGVGCSFPMHWPPDHVGAKDHMLLLRRQRGGLDEKTAPDDDGRGSSLGGS